MNGYNLDDDNDMNAVDDQEEDVANRIKAAVHYTVGKICEEYEKEHNAKCTPQFIHSLASIVHHQAETMVLDLAAFAKHAKRQQVNADDVRLLVRRNDGLVKMLNDYADDLKETKKKRKS
ncbi:hypothetical protein HDU76_003799 [Blyttiomyces sp. JEL0837]|nr:hypothetical protein HDU76_003799 [Blyttiomyces sp. JEL0837]